MKPEAKAPVFWVLVALIIVLEIQRFKRIIEQAQVHVDTINRIRGGRAGAIDMRGHMKSRAATIADWCIVTLMQKNT